MESHPALDKFGYARANQQLVNAWLLAGKLDVCSSIVLWSHWVVCLLSKTICLLLGSWVVMGGLVWLLLNAESRTNPFAENGGQSTSITLFCAASNRAVIEDIRQAYASETGRRVEIQYGASQTLLSQLKVEAQADLYLPADDSFLELADDMGLTADVLPIAEMQVGLAVAKGNPLKIESLADLLRTDVRLVQANPDTAAVGRLAQRVLRESSDWPAVDRATVAYRPTVSDVTNDLLLDAADVGIVYDALLHTYPQLEFVALPEFQTATAKISVAVLRNSKRPDAARQFAVYIASADHGLKHYAAHGFTISNGSMGGDELAAGSDSAESK